MQVELFGGAITSEYPTNLTDASDLRQVPDTQEVFLANDSDLSIILEVLQLVTEDGSGESLEAGIKYHFNSLAHDNSSLATSISQISPLDSDHASSLIEGPVTLRGTQQISKFNKPDSQADTVSIYVALWRIKQKNTDLVLTMNWPLKVHDENGNVKAQSDGTKAVESAFLKAVRSLAIVDFGLFAG